MQKAKQLYDLSAIRETKFHPVSKQHYRVSSMVSHGPDLERFFEPKLALDRIRTDPVFIVQRGFLP